MRLFYPLVPSNWHASWLAHRRRSKIFLSNWVDAIMDYQGRTSKANGLWSNDWDCWNGGFHFDDGNTKMLIDLKVKRLSNNIECWWLLGGDRMCHNAMGHEPWCINFQVPPWFWLQPWFYTLHGWSLGYTWVGMEAKLQELSFGLFSDIIWINFQTIWLVLNRHEKQQRAEKIEWKPMISN